VYSKCGATDSFQRANAALMGYPVTKTIRTESNATHEIKNYYQDTGHSWTTPTTLDCFSKFKFITNKAEVVKQI